MEGLTFIDSPKLSMPLTKKEFLANKMRGLKKLGQEYPNRLVGFLFRHSRESFARHEVMKALSISDHTAKRLLQNHPYAKPTLVSKDGKVLRYRSLAPMPKYTEAGKEEIQEALARFDDDLGKQAREDLDWTTQRGKPGRKRKKVIWRA